MQLKSERKHLGSVAFSPVFPVALLCRGRSDGQGSSRGDVEETDVFLARRQAGLDPFILPDGFHLADGLGLEACLLGQPLSQRAPCLGTARSSAM